jgi:hypothetical protein
MTDEGTVGAPTCLFCFFVMVLYRVILWPNVTHVIGVTTVTFVTFIQSISDMCHQMCHRSLLEPNFNHVRRGCVVCLCRKGLLDL